MAPLSLKKEHETINSLFNTFIWVIKIMGIYQKGNAEIGEKIIYKEYGVQKQATLETVITILSSIINDISEDENQAELCLDAIKTMGKIYDIC